MNKNLIKFLNIYKSFNHKFELKNINFSINEGEIFAIMGHSGAGKTTILRILGFLDYPDKGKYLINSNILNMNQKFINVFEQSRSFYKKISKSFTMVFQHPVMFNMSVFDNIAYGLKIRGIKTGVIKQKVENIIEKLNLKEVMYRNARTLSGGEIQRTALARAFVLETRVLILDEPTANLDPSNASIVESLICEYKNIYNSTIIIATHNLFQVKRIADRVLHIYKGIVVENDSVENVFNNPKSEITNKFINGEIYF